MAEVVLFAVVATVAVAGGLGVVLARNPVYAAMGLLATMFALAVAYVAHLAHFVALVQVIVYAGAVVLLFLFVIMLIGVDRAEDTTEQLPAQRMLVVTFVGAVFAIAAVLFFAVGFRWIGPEPAVSGPTGTIEALADELFTGWLLPVLSTAVLLTIAAVGALSLAHFRSGREGP